MQPFPWADAIGFGLGVLRLAPEQFWRMTPRELAYAAQGLSNRPPPLQRADFTQLMQRYPDVRPDR